MRCSCKQSFCLRSVLVTVCILCLTIVTGAFPSSQTIFKALFLLKLETCIVYIHVCRRQSSSFLPPFVRQCLLTSYQHLASPSRTHVLARFKSKRSSVNGGQKLKRAPLRKAQFKILWDEHTFGRWKCVTVLGETYGGRRMRLRPCRESSSIFKDCSQLEK